MDIVCLGSSSGGLTALIAFFTRMAPASGMAFVVIQHLQAEAPALTPAILSRITSMSVSAARDGERVLPDHVYTIPANAELTILAGRLWVAKRTLAAARHKPFDRFLDSLAADCGPRAIAVVLSGYDGDGSAGFVAIKAHGGTTYAQDRSARVDEMPQHAMATGCVDHVLDPQGIAERIASGARRTVVSTGVREADEETPTEA
jgi:two-component system CheB/CheR fusion protein